LLPVLRDAASAHWTTEGAQIVTSGVPEDEPAGAEDALGSADADAEGEAVIADDGAGASAHATDCNATNAIAAGQTHTVAWPRIERASGIRQRPH